MAHNPNFNSAKTLEIFPCPFCENDLTNFCEDDLEGWIECLFCRARGPLIRKEIFYNKNVVIKKWNVYKKNL